ncbi:MAG: glycerol-3-phosphate 1-O-acyltransferase PlsY [Armatimonadetes bacterium]|nr:glycerol-3-phosphate 1-O-acyltransferase PlsY [Armatimonadota bacterium]
MLIALAVLAFLLGSIPFGVIICKAKGVDIFKVGSGNIGATNVVRAVGPTLGGLVFLLDVAKGFVPGILAHFLIQGEPLGLNIQVWSFIFGAVAMLGHMFSPWIGFKGGKGVATGLGAVLASIPQTGLLAMVVMIIVTVPTRYVSLGSIVAALSVIPISALVVHDSPQMRPFLVILAVFVVYRHRSNIKRLLNGTENKFNFRKNEDNEKKGEERRNDEDGRP